MAWRPAPRSNPLLALRRVVERPDGAGPASAWSASRGDHPGTVRVAPAGTATVATPRPLFDGLEAAIAAGGSPPAAPPDAPPNVPRGRSAGRGRPWSGIPSGRRRSDHVVSRIPASQPEPSHRDPGRSPQTLITTTPAEASDLALLPPLPPMTPRPAVVISPAAMPARRHPPAHPRPAPQSRPALPDPTASPATAWPTAAGPDPTTSPPAVAPTPMEPTDVGAPGADLTVASTSGPGLMAPRRVLTVMVACLGLWAMLDSPALYRSAAASPIGTRRRAALDVLGPLSRATAFVGVDRIGRAADELRGRQPHRPPKPTPLARAAPVLMGPLPRPVTTPQAPPIAVGPLRVPSASDPLRVLVVGDSLGLSFGQSVAAKLDASGVTKTTVDAREGTGLTRPDSFDWVAQLEADVVRFHPEVVVASFGGNDDQDVQINGRYIGFSSPQWQDVYRARVTKIADEVAAAHARLVWSGLPVMRSSAKNSRLATVMTVARSAIDGRPAALWLPNAATLADASGHYQAALPGPGSRLEIVREPDGIHETRAGADRLADRAIAAMVSAWKLTIKSGGG